MRKILLAGIALLALAGCGQPATAPADKSAITLPTDSWKSFRDAFIEDWFKLDPANAVYQGRHDFDGQLPNWSAAGLATSAAVALKTWRT